MCTMNGSHLEFLFILVRIAMVSALTWERLKLYAKISAL